MPRTDWDAFFLRIASEVAEQATCDRLHAGTVLVRDRRILATGFNGSPPGHKHCDDAGHLLMQGHCVRTVHSEINAIANAARMGVSTMGATAYINWTPCWSCVKALLSAGVERIVFQQVYPNAAATWPEGEARVVEKEEFYENREYYCTCLNVAPHYFIDDRLFF